MPFPRVVGLFKCAKQYQHFKSPFAEFYGVDAHGFGGIINAAGIPSTVSLKCCLQPSSAALALTVKLLYTRNGVLLPSSSMGVFYTFKSCLRLLPQYGEATDTISILCGERERQPASHKCAREVWHLRWRLSIMVKERGRWVVVVIIRRENSKVGHFVYCYYYCSKKRKEGEKTLTNPKRLCRRTVRYNSR